MKKYLIIIFLLFILIENKCGIQNYINDPQSWGGSNCTDDTACNYPDGGYCHNNICICSIHWANPNCTYKRYPSKSNGILNIVLPFVGICGISGTIIQKGEGPIQLGVGLISISFSIIFLVFSCCFFKIKSFESCASAILLLILGIVAMIIYISMLIYSIVEGSQMLKCTIQDGNGYSLYTDTYIQLFNITVS